MRRSKRIIVRSHVIEKLVTLATSGSFYNSIYFYARQSAKNINVRVAPEVERHALEYDGYVCVMSVTPDSDMDAPAAVIDTWRTLWYPELRFAIRNDPFFEPIQGAD